MPRSLKFLYFTTFYPPYSFGGDAVYLHRVAHALAEQGHSVDVVHCVDSYHILDPGKPGAKFAEHPNVVRHELSHGVGWLSPLLAHQTGRPLLNLAKLRKIANSKPFDVVHYHNISLLGPGVLGIGPQGGQAVKLYTTHEHWLVCPMHVLWKYDERVCEKPDCLKCVLRGWRPPQLWRYTGLLKRSAAKVDRFLSPSRFTAAMHAERGFPYPVETLPYFMDRCDEDWRNPAPRPQERPYFLFVGRLEHIKGIHTLIDAWRGAGQWDLLVAGAGTADEELRRQAAGNPRIRFLGHQSQRALGALYAHAVATIVPSVTYETFGMILIESFARKTPVIVRDLGALPEVVRESGGGLIYRDNAELMHAAGSLAGEAGRREELGTNGYEAFLRLWTRQAHLNLYEQHINAARKPTIENLEEWRLTSSLAARAS
ncbi:MAG: glycosyltransferase family 4 protein [Acidobacteria bacterium]|nr:glycosyltransferase family 4 protein [Acidobacteriota bacterium]